MTVEQAIARTDALYPNSFSFSVKERWLAELDGKIAAELYPAYSGGGAQGADACFKPGLAGSELSVPFPYDDIYIKFLSMRCDEAGGDIARYNNSAAVFNASLVNYLSAFNSSHTARCEKIRL